MAASSYHTYSSSLNVTIDGVVVGYRTKCVKNTDAILLVRMIRWVRGAK